MDDIKSFVRNVVEDKEKGSFKQEVLDGKVLVRMSVHRDKNSAGGSWSILIKDILPDSKSLKDYGSIEEMSSDIGVENNFEDFRSGFGFLGDDFEELENNLISLIDDNFGHNPYEPSLEIPRDGDSEYDLVFHDSFVIFE